MDICMFTPSERGELQTLLAEYNQARVKLETFLLTIQKEWQKEVLSEPTAYLACGHGVFRDIAYRHFVSNVNYL
jgi:hypothetical protein